MMRVPVLLPVPAAVHSSEGPRYSYAIWSIARSFVTVARAKRIIVVSSPARSRGPSPGSGVAILMSRRSPAEALRASCTAFVLVAAAAAHLPGQGVPRADIVLQPGDAIGILVWRQPDLSGDFEIDAAGRVLHPLYRSVTVTGVPLAVAAARLASVVNQQQAGAEFSLQALLRVSVEGEVRNTGVERHPPVTTIAQAIALAGGVTDRARTNRVRLVRGDSITLLDLRDPTDPAVRMPIQSGDRIIVDVRRPLREYIVPVISMLGTAASVANLLRRSR